MPFIVLILFLCCTQLQGATTASVDYKRVKLGQNIQLNISSDNAAGARPKLTVIKRHFRVLGSSMVSRPYIKEGKRAQKTIWYYVLQPKRAGNLTIPAFKINNEQTAAIAIHVIGKKKAQHKASTSPKSTAVRSGITISAAIDVKKAYPNQQITYSVKLFYPEKYKDLIALKAPYIPGAISVSIGKKTEREAVRKKVKGYESIEHFAIFAGPISRYQISAASVEFRSSAQAPSQQISAKPITFDILPQANKTSAGYWLPSPSVALSEHWKRPKTLYVGDTIEREITLKATKLNSDILPLMSTLSDEKMQITLQDIQVDNDSSSILYKAVRKERISMTMQSAGTISLPPIDIHWWNTEKNHAQVSSLPAVILTVLDRAPTTVKQTIATSSTLNNTEVSAMDPPKTTEGAQLQTWIIAILGTLLLLTSSGWLYSASKKASRR